MRCAPAGTHTYDTTAIDAAGNVHSKMCCTETKLSPCIFEHVYMARPDSIIDGVSVYQARLIMGEKLAANIKKKHPDHDIDVVMPIPDTSRTSALQCSYALGLPYREGFIKNRLKKQMFPVAFHILT